MSLHAVLSGYVEAELAVPSGQSVAVVGPNGAGKTSLLRALAGLPSPAHATLTIDGADRGGTHPHQRSVGYVPQDGALFPHLSALGNVAYGLRARGVRRPGAQALARQWLDRLEIGELAGRRPGQLSGGQAQRVALARALAADPRLLLLDEPLSALDQSVRAGVRHDLRRHLDAFTGVCLLVTHEPVDAAALADRMLVLDGGRVAQDGTPVEVTRAPRGAWVARMLGRNAYTGTVTATGVAFPGGELITAEQLAVGTVALATILPEAVAVYRQRPHGSPRNCWPGRVSEISPLGARVRVTVTGEDGPDIVAEVTPAAAADLELTDDSAVWVAVKATEIEITPL